MIFQHKSQFVRECVPIEAKKKKLQPATVDKIDKAVY